MKNGLAIVTLVVGTAMGLSAPVAEAQQVMVAASIGDGPAMGSSGRIAKGSVEAYARLLGMSEDQKSSALALHDGYDAAYTQANKEFTTALKEMQQTAEESGDHTVWGEKMPKAREELSKKTKAIEKGFMSDLQALLSTDQSGKWDKVERHRRREVLLRPGTVSGEGVNLLDTVEGLKLEGDAAAQVSEIMAAYESDIDRALQAKQRVQDEQTAFDPGKGFDIEEFQKRMEKSREAGLAIREVNQQYQRRLESSLPEGKRPAFTEAVKKATYPQVYRPSRVARQMDAAVKFDDLTSEQRESLSSLKSGYEREVAPVNDRCASEVDAAEKKGDNGGEMAVMGGGRMAVRFGEEDNDSPLAQARKARRELDEKTRARMDSILTKEQKERLPKEQDQRADMVGKFVTENAVRVGR